MYREHFDLKDRPFTQAPGQRFFAPNATVTDAVAHLRHVMTARDSVALVTGGPGVGKSTLAEVALAEITDPAPRVARVDLRYGEPEEIYAAILAALGEDPGELRPARAQQELRRTLGRLVRDGQPLVVCLDIGSITTEVARHLLRLVNLAGEVDGRLNLVLMGPHPLHQQLDVPALIQLRQRIAFRYRVRPLTLAETERYVRHQVAEVGGDATALLSSSVSAAVYCYVAGVPRLINTLIDASLTEASLQEQPRPDGSLVKRTAESLGWKPMTPPQAGDGSARPAAAVARPAPPRSTPPRVAIVASGNPAERTRPAEAPAAKPVDLPPPSEMTMQLRSEAVGARAGNVTLASDARSPTAAMFGGDDAAPRKSAATDSGLAEPPVAMDEVDTSATGMLRLQDLDDRFAETIFGKEADTARGGD